MYILRFTPRFIRAYGNLDSTVRDQIDESLDRLKENPRHPSLRTHKRKGEVNTWQARATRNHRIYFEFDGETIILMTVTAHE